MSEKIEPIMTPEEWACWTDPNSSIMDRIAALEHIERSGRSLRVAEGAIRPREAGYFTWEDVDRLNSIRARLAPGGDWLTREEHDGLGTTIAKLASLLPPRETP